MNMKKLLFGTAGVPLSTPQRTTINGIEHLNTLGLDGMELEFVRNINIGEKRAPEVNNVAKKNGKVLTCHGQYYINLSSLEQHKIDASIKRIKDAAHIANLCGAWSLTFHAAFYQKQDKKKVFLDVKNALRGITDELKQLNNPIWIRPETTGKETQFGTVEEILDLSVENDQVMPCIDFSHLHARSNGKYNTFEEFSSVLDQVENKLGKKGLNNMHMHVSGIDYGQKGEKKHLILEESDMNYGELLRALKEYSVKGILICESPNIEEDASLLKKTYNEL
jgi:deoxyribonuclease-4